MSAQTNHFTLPMHIHLKAFVLKNDGARLVKCAKEVAKLRNRRKP
jgi:metal-responsive CopG/Arc/MetJ family transcriptional regulator